MSSLKENIERMMKPYREIEKILKPIERFQIEWANNTNVFQDAFEPITQLQKNLSKPLNQFQDSLENISKIYLSIPEIENPFLEYLDTFKVLGEILKEYAEKTPENFLIIAQHGWFIDLDGELNIPSKVANLIRNKKIDDANRFLSDYYISNIDTIFESLSKRHTNRKEIFDQIKSSFYSGNHALLIPVIFTQIDGICFDFTKKKFFLKDKNNKDYKFLPEVTIEIEKTAGVFLELYLSPLKNQTPITAREKDLKKFPCRLNRHEVLHGVSTDYGTELNSLKAISLLKYISDLLTDLDNKTYKNIAEKKEEND